MDHKDHGPVNPDSKSIPADKFDHCMQTRTLSYHPDEVMHHLRRWLTRRVAWIHAGRLLMLYLGDVNFLNSRTHTYDRMSWGRMSRFYGFRTVDAMIEVVRKSDIFFNGPDGQTAGFYSPHVKRQWDAADRSLLARQQNQEQPAGAVPVCVAEAVGADEVEVEVAVAEAEMAEMAPIVEAETAAESEPADRRDDAKYADCAPSEPLLPLTISDLAKPSSIRTRERKLQEQEVASNADAVGAGERPFAASTPPAVEAAGRGRSPLDPQFAAHLRTMAVQDAEWLTALRREVEGTDTDAVRRPRRWHYFLGLCSRHMMRQHTIRPDYDTFRLLFGRLVNCRLGRQMRLRAAGEGFDQAELRAEVCDARRLAAEARRRQQECLHRAHNYRPLSPYEWQIEESGLRFYDDDEGIHPLPADAAPRPSATAIFMGGRWF